MFLVECLPASAKPLSGSFAGRATENRHHSNAQATVLIETCRIARALDQKAKRASRTHYFESASSLGACVSREANGHFASGHERQGLNVSSTRHRELYLGLSSVAVDQPS